MLKEYVSYVIDKFEKSDDFISTEYAYVKLQGFISNGRIVHTLDKLKIMDVGIFTSVLCSEYNLSIESYETFLLKNKLKLL